MAEPLASNQTAAGSSPVSCSKGAWVRFPRRRIAAIELIAGHDGCLPLIR